MKIKICRSMPDNFRAAKRAPSHIQFLVLHDAAGESAAACATQLSGAVLTKSVHFFVDEQSVWQSVEEHDIAWHCGTRGTYFHPLCRNENSIGIAVCGEDAAGRPVISQKTQLRAAALVQQLMQKYSIAPSHVLRDYDVTHRCCPAMFVERASAWREFMQSLALTRENKKQTF